MGASGQAIVFVFFGEKYLEQFKATRITMPKHWNVYVITDVKIESDSMTVINVPTPATVFDMLAFRKNIDLYVPIEQFDQVWYSDCDILFFQDILAKYAGERERILVSNEPFCTIDNEHFCGDMTIEEIALLKEANAPAINGGFYCIPHSQYHFFPHYREALEAYAEKKPGVLATDQHVLNSVLHLDRFIYRLFDPGDVGFETGHGAQYKGRMANHYIGIYEPKAAMMLKELKARGEV